MSIQLWEGYFLRWVQAKTVNITIAERNRMREIVSRNKEAQVDDDKQTIIKALIYLRLKPTS